jgi:DNA-directed RNA polymerase subunit H (RpoH/RPB5)
MREYYIMSSTLLFNNVYTSRNIILYILEKYRGYDTSEFDDWGIDATNNRWSEGRMDMRLTHKHKSDEHKIFIKYNISPANGGNPARGRLKPTTLDTILEDVYDEEENMEKKITYQDELIILINHKVNDSLRAALTKVYSDTNRFVNIYNINDYLFNILDNVLVPPHKVLSDVEKKQIFNKYYIREDSNFPEISRYDPVAKTLGARPGDLLEITRPSPTAIQHKYYRLCQ